MFLNNFLSEKKNLYIYFLLTGTSPSYYIIKYFIPSLHLNIYHPVMTIYIYLAIK